jgi:hypothetical protein
VQVAGTFCVFREAEVREVDTLLEDKQISLVDLGDLEQQLA